MDKNLFSMMFNELSVTLLRNNGSKIKRKDLFIGNVQNSLIKDLEFREYFIIQCISIAKLYILLAYNKEVLYDELFEDYSTIDLSKFKYTFPNISNKLRKMEIEILEKENSLKKSKDKLQLEIAKEEDKIINFKKIKELKNEYQDIVEKMIHLIEKSEAEIEKKKTEKIALKKEESKVQTKKAELNYIKNSQDPSLLLSKFDFITHLRNSVAHGNYQFIASESGKIEEQLVTFEDYNPDSKEKTFHAEIKLDNLLDFLDNEIHTKLFTETKSLHI